MQWPVARYRLQAEVTHPIYLPAYAGSMLRGAFGQSLRRLACTTRQPQCHTCSAQANCAYHLLFEAPSGPHSRLSPNPYVIEPPLGVRHLDVGQMLDFAMVLIGPAQALLPIILQAWTEALARGLGTHKGTARLQRLYSEHDPEPIPPQQWPNPSPQLIKWTPPPKAKESLQLILHTPLRLQHQGGLVGLRELTAPIFLTSLMRRIQGLGLQPEHYSVLLEQAQAIRLAQPLQLHWFDWDRYSSRQQQQMTLGGLMGHLNLEGPLADWLPWLHLGQWLHLGKNATFGLGHYQIGHSAIPTQSVLK